MNSVLLGLATLTPLIAVLTALAIPSAARRVDRISVTAMAVATIASLGLVAQTARSTGRTQPEGAAAWLGLTIDRPSALLLAAATGVALVVTSFSTRAVDREHPQQQRYYAGLAAVATGSALVVVPGGPVPLVLGWVLAGRGLLDLTRGWSTNAQARAANRRLAISLRVGDLALLGAVAVASATGGAGVFTGSSSSLVDLADASVLGLGAEAVVALLVVVAGATRSALVPFHRWLLATLHAPTPVSALVHAGFVSGAGLLLLRFATPFSATTAAIVLALVLAIATVLIGVGASLSRADSKGALAWSTVAQMGFMVVQVAIGAFAGAIFHIIGHGMYKAAQFLGVGDTVAAGLRKRRRPALGTPLAGTARALVTVGIATAATALGLTLVGPNGLPGDETIVLGAFAWLALASGVGGVLASSALPRTRAVAVAAVGAFSASATYFAGLRFFKDYLGSSIVATDVDATPAAVVLVGGIAGLAAVTLVPAARDLRCVLRSRIERITALRPDLDLASVTVTAPITGHSARIAAATERSEAERLTAAARLHAEAARAAEPVAPSWPLSSFVAVNPLGGLEDLGFDAAAAKARRLLGVRTHQPLDRYRAGHAAGLTTEADLRFVAHDLAMVACSQPSLELSTRRIDAVDVVVADLMHGPDVDVDESETTTLGRALAPGGIDALGIDDLVARWATDHMAPPTWRLTTDGQSFIELALGQAISHATDRLSPEAAAWLSNLPASASRVLDEALYVTGVADADRVDEIERHLAGIPGWTGIARWRTEWAQPDEATPELRPIDLAAARAMLEAAVAISIEGRPVAARATTLASPGGPATPAFDHRVDRVLEALHLDAAPETRAAVAAVLHAVPPSLRSSMWLRAQERNYESSLLAALDDGSHSGEVDVVPDAQVVFCIDVRSEGLRRRLEAQGHDETIGFAGFFGVPMQVRELGWQQSEPRCPVLVSPSASVLEHPLADHVHDAARRLTRTGSVNGVRAAHSSTKDTPGAAFAAAEGLGWFTGLAAAWRTLTPAPAARAQESAATIARLGDDVFHDQRVFAAESALRTMGLTRDFAELVVLCGHTSANVNNAHGTALECGACAGAGGATNARAVASLLNEPDVRAGLAGRGIEIPDETWFSGAVHDTASDMVTLLDRHLVPAGHQEAFNALQARLHTAGDAQSAARAARLPGATSADDVSRRGQDWAQVRAEWGLARNAAFVIAPRSTTRHLDLDGRAFLHTYDSADDPDGSVLEAIMTAPLVVGHWISSQYYFSTVDRDRLGAGDKLLHNPIGTLGVLAGSDGDLRVGLPAQSTHVADQPFHQPLRLLAVIDADLTVVEQIIARNDVLRRLVEGSWIHVAARAMPTAAWSTRSAGGVWSELPRSARVHKTLQNH